jgi:nicotinamidase-related amidase
MSAMQKCRLRRVEYSGMKGSVMAATDGHPALLIIDMVKDNFREDRKLPITPLACGIIDPLNRLIGVFHDRGWPVVFSTDAFQEADFIFSARMPPHSLAGTEGAEVIEELDRAPADYWLPKPRFSAFFRTGLEVWLRERGVTLCAVGGIATHFCVLTTVMDAICNDFKAVLLADGSAAPTESIHEQTLAAYRRNPLYPLLRVMRTEELAEELLRSAK